MPINHKIILSAKNKTDAVFQKVKGNFDAVNNKATALASALVSVAGIGGFGLLIKNQGEAIRQARIYSDALGIQVKELMAWQVAAKSLNIESDKMGDIFKDLSEKIGDAFANGSGEALEVLDRLKISTADIVALSPDQQLLKIAGALDQVGTKSEKIQILEGLASDASLLLPLLDDGASKFIEIRSEAEKYGNALSAIDVEKVRQANEAADKSKLAWEGVATQLNVKLSPVLEEINKRFERMGQQAAKFLGLESSQERINTLFAERKTLLDEIERRSELGENAQSARMVLLRRQTESLKGELNELINAKKKSARASINEHKAAIAARKEAAIRAREELQERTKKENSEAISKNLDRVRAGLLGEEEALRASYDARALIVQQAFDNEQISDQQRADLKTKLQEKLESDLTKTRDREAKKRKALETQVETQIINMKMSIAGQAAQLIRALAPESKKAAIAALAIEKGIAIAQTLISTEVAAMQTRTALIMPGNPGSVVAAETAAARVRALGAISIGLIAATGLAQAASINSGGGGGVSAPSLSPTQESINDVVDPAGTSPHGGSVTINVYNPELLSDQSIDNLAEGLASRVEDRDFILVRPESRNGQELSAA